MCIALLGSCSDDNSFTGNEENKDVPGSEETEQVEATPFKPLTLSTRQSEIAANATDFSLNLLKSVSEGENDNVVISPLGFHSLFSMLANAGTEEVSREITDKLGVSSVEELNNYYNSIFSALKDADNQVSVSSANSFWSKHMEASSQETLNTLNNLYDCDFFPLGMDSFKNITDINNWCAEKTNGLIDQIFDPNSDFELLNLILNSLYFDGKWTNAFKEDDSELLPFTNLDNSNSMVSMMRSKRYVSASKLENGIMISLPYGNGTYKMNMILPDAGYSPSDLITDKIQLIPPKTQEYCDLYIPKFDVEYARYNLKDTFKKLGFSKSFETKAFPLIGGGMTIDMLFQKCVLKVSETGAKAAAITGAADIGWGGTPESPAEVRIDRPFIFSITAYDKIILFSGIINKL